MGDVRNGIGNNASAGGILILYLVVFLHRRKSILDNLLEDAEVNISQLIDIQAPYTFFVFA